MRETRHACLLRTMPVTSVTGIVAFGAMQAAGPARRMRPFWSIIEALRDALSGDDRSTASAANERLVSRGIPQ